MWSVLRAGYEADAVLVGESTGLRLGHAATGVCGPARWPAAPAMRCSPAARARSTASAGR